MFLHIGGDIVVALDELVAILDMETSKREATKEFLGFAVDEKTITYISKQEREKSVIITKDRIYISPISTTTLLRRSLIQTVGSLVIES